MPPRRSGLPVSCLRIPDRCFVPRQWPQNAETATATPVLAAGTTRAALEAIVSGISSDPPEGPLRRSAPRPHTGDVLAPAPPLLLLDEPTRGLDYEAKERLSRQLRQLAAKGHCVVVATHDVELVAEVADRVVVLADGEVITDGPARSVVCHSAGLASQVARVLSPAEWLTVEEVATALHGGPPENRTSS